MEYNKNNEKLIRWCKVLTSATRDEILEELGDKLMDEKARKKLLENIDRNSRNEEIIKIYEMYPTWQMEREAEIYEVVEKAKKNKPLKLLEK